MKLILLLLIVVCMIFIHRSYSPFSENEIKVATAILTRGYKNNNGYNQLIKRNNALYTVFNKKYPKADNIIFHEGNITDVQQNYIQSKTPNLKLQFYPVQFLPTPLEKNPICPKTKQSEEYGNGYKNMCYFWTYGFLYSPLAKYDYIFRVDEDCILNKIQDNLFNEYKTKNIVYSSPMYQGPDEPDVVTGMQDFFDNFMKKRNINPYTTNARNPYTNVFIMDIQYFLHNNVITDVVKEIKDSTCIFSNRWGDLPIWGYILSYFVKPQMYIEDKNISYFHGSHSTIVN